MRPAGWLQNKTLSDNISGFVLFKEGKTIELNDKGEVTKGTLNQETKLLSSDGTIKVYEADTTVEFNNTGMVVNASNDKKI